jgi:rod shape-determining protein MreC
VAFGGGHRVVAGLALPIRVWAQRAAFFSLIAAAFALMLLSKTETALVERARLEIVDIFAPLLDVMSRPVQSLGKVVDTVETILFVHADNDRLRRDNAALTRWMELARQLELENATLRAQLNSVPDRRPRFVTARIIADTGGAFFHSVLINAGARDFVRRGQPVMAHDALVGRVDEVGQRSARVLLITDLNSRIPVTIQSTGERAVLAGTNTGSLKLLYLPSASPASGGDRIVTSGHGGVFPPGLLVGTVGEVSENHTAVEPLVDFSRLGEALVMDFGIDGLAPTPERVPISPPATATRTGS